MPIIAHSGGRTGTHYILKNIIHNFDKYLVIYAIIVYNIGNILEEGIFYGICFDSDDPAADRGIGVDF